MRGSTSTRFAVYMMHIDMVSGRIAACFSSLALPGALSSIQNHDTQSLYLVRRLVDIENLEHKLLRFLPRRVRRVSLTMHQ